MSEFVEATERLAHIRPAVSIFGSARAPADSPYYLLSEQIARLLSDAGFSVISGGGPGASWKRPTKGAYFGKSPASASTSSCRTSRTPIRYQDISQTFRHFFARKVMFVKFATAYVVMPGRLRHAGRTDGGADPGADRQRRAKSPSSWCSRSGAGCWTGSATAVGEGMINPEDLDLVQMIDDPAAVVEAIFKYYEKRGFEPCRRNARPCSTYGTTRETEARSCGVGSGARASYASQAGRLQAPCRQSARICSISEGPSESAKIPSR